MGKLRFHETAVTTATWIALMACCPSASAQAIQPVEVASYGPAGLDVTETDIAVGDGNVVAVYIATNAYDFTDSRIGYAHRTSDSWTSDVISNYVDPTLTLDGVTDPSVVFDRSTGEFVCGALGSKTRPPQEVDKYILISRFHPDDPLPGWDDWQILYMATGSALESALDKPFLVAGELDEAKGQEPYLLCMEVLLPAQTPVYRYFRQRGVGETWVHDRIGVSGEPVQGLFSAQPSVYDDGPIYMAYHTYSTPYQFEFLVGADDNATGGVDWDYLRDDATAQHLFVAFNHPAGPWNDKLPGFFFTGSRAPQLAVDPTSPDRLFIAYDDTDPCPCPPGEPDDVEVYVTRLDRQPSEDWLANPKVRVHEDRDPGDSDKDQFKPVITVDTQGWVHVVFYDDIMHGANDRFDLHWAVSTNNGVGYRHSYPPVILPNEAMLDLELDTTKPSPREYNGLDFFLDDQGTLTIWTSFMGTHWDPAFFPETAIFAAYLEVTP